MKENKWRSKLRRKEFSKINEEDYVKYRKKAMKEKVRY